MNQKYMWKLEVNIPQEAPGTIKGIRAEVAGTIFDQISKERGGLRPEYVVDASIPEDAPMHNCFEWDDQIAGKKYRIEQARTLIRCLVIVTEKKDEEQNITRSFVNIRKPDGEKTWLPVKDVMSDRALREQYITRAYKELKEWQERYNSIKEFSEICQIIKFMDLEKLVNPT